MKLRLLLHLLLIVAVLAPLSVAAQDDACPAGAVAEDAPEITIGATASQTGRYAREGTDMLNGYNLWLAWVNQEAGGINVDGECYKAALVVYDDASGKLQVEDLYHQLIEQDEVDILLAPYASDLTMIASEVADAGGVLMVQGNGAAEGLFTRGFENFFGVLTPASQYTRSGIEEAYALGARTAVLAYEDAAFAEAVAVGAQATMEELGIEVLASETYPVGAEDVTDLFTEFTEMAPDLFVGGGHYEDAVLIVQTAKSLNFNPSVMLITVGPSIPSFVTDLGEDANSVWGASQWESSLGFEDEWFGTAAEFAERYEGLYGVGPSYQAASASAAALTLQLGIEAAGSLETEAVSAALHGLDVETFYGPIAFDETGKNIGKPMVTTQIEAGEIVVIAPDEAAVADPLYPAPAWGER